MRMNFGVETERKNAGITARGHVSVSVCYSGVYVLPDRACYCFTLAFTRMLIIGCCGSLVIIKIRGVPFTRGRFSASTVTFSLVDSPGFSVRFFSLTASAILNTCMSCICKSDRPVLVMTMFCDFFWVGFSATNSN